MNTELLEIVKEWIDQNIQRARIARDTTKAEQQRLMLCGKVKAYTDVLCFVKDKIKENK